MRLSDHIVRCKVDVGDRFTDFKDILVNRPPGIWTASRCRLDFGLYYKDSFLDDISALQSMSLDIKVASTTETSLITAPIIPVQCTEAEWLGGTKAHGSVELSSAMIDQDAGQYYMVLYGILVVATLPDRITLGKTTLNIIESGVTALGSYTPPSGEYPSPAELAAMISNCVKFYGNPDGATMTLRAYDGSTRELGVSDGALPIDNLTPP